MKKLFSSLLLIGVLIPNVAEAHHKKPRCRTEGKVVVCKMPKPHKKKCTRKRPCVQPGYYRPNPPRRIPMFIN